MLTDAMRALIGLHSIGAIGTTGADGAAAVSHKATFLALDNQTLAFADIRSPRTVANLQRDPRVEIVFTDPFHRTGCRVSGRASYRTCAKEDEAVMAPFKDRWPDLYAGMKGIVTIRCETVEMLTSPSYDVGATAVDLADTWLHRFADALGYDVVRRSC